MANKRKLIEIKYEIEIRCERSNDKIQDVIPNEYMNIYTLVINLILFFLI